MEEKFNSRETARDFRIFLGTLAEIIDEKNFINKVYELMISFLPSCSILGSERSSFDCHSILPESASRKFIQFL